MSRQFERDGVTVREIAGVEYEWRNGVNGVGWYCDAKRWFLTAVQADGRATVAPTLYSTPPVAHVSAANVNPLLMWSIYMLWPVALCLNGSADAFTRFHARQALSLMFWRWPLLILFFLLGIPTLGIATLGWAIYWFVKAGIPMFIGASRACRGEMWVAPILESRQVAPVAA